MEKCNDCEIKEFKDTKYRPMNCCGCELNYHWLKLLDDLSETWLFRIFRLMKQNLNFMRKED